MDNELVLVCYQEIVYDLNELAGLIGKPGEQYFSRIMRNLDRIICNRPESEQPSTNK